MVLRSRRVEEGLIITNPVSLIGSKKIEICFEIPEAVWQSGL